MPSHLLHLLCAAALCFLIAGCGSAAVETADVPGTPIAGYRSVIVTVPLERGIDPALTRTVEAEAVKAIKEARRWRLVVAGSLAAGQRQGLRVLIEIDETDQNDAFKAFTNTLTATVGLSDVATGERLGGVTVTASGASVEFAGQAVAQQAAEWVTALP